MPRSRKRKPSRASFNLLDSKTQIDKLAFRARLAIQIVGGGLALIFTWLQVKDFPVAPFLEHIEPQTLLKVILAFYYFCWVFGLSFDVTTQQAVYVKDPSRGQFAWDAISAVVILAIVATALLWASNDERKFAAVLSVFVVINIGLWKYVLYRVKPIIHESGKLCKAEERYFEFERLRVVEDYISGKWQRDRFIVMLIAVVFADLICFVNPARETLSTAIGFLSTGLPASSLSQILPDLSILLFVAIAEGWIWLKRFITRTSLRIIAKLNEKYVLAQRTH